MAELRPRNFAAMRGDRVLDLASRCFGRSYTSRTAAIADLSALPVSEQHALKKRGAPAKKLRAAASSSRKFYDTRGGLAPAPSADKLARAAVERPAAVMRLARTTTGMKVSSPAQALTLLRKFGATGMARAADAAFRVLKGGKAGVALSVAGAVAAVVASRSSKAEASEAKPVAKNKGTSIGQRNIDAGKSKQSGATFESVAGTGMIAIGVAVGAAGGAFPAALGIAGGLSSISKAADLRSRGRGMEARGHAIEALISKVRGGSPALGMRGVVPDAPAKPDGKRPAGMMKLGGPAPASDEAGRTSASDAKPVDKPKNKLRATATGRRAQQSADISKGGAGFGAILSATGVAATGLAALAPFAAKTPQGAVAAAVVTAAAYISTRMMATATGDLIQRSSDKEARGHAIEALIAKGRGGSPALGTRGVVPAAPGKAYLNGAAEKKAAAPPKPAPAPAPAPAAAGRQAAAAPSSDGETAGYSRIDPRTGSRVTVKAYKTPKRR